ncbi:MAG: metal-dependent hydrolase [Polyangiales bacterium]
MDQASIRRPEGLKVTYRRMKFPFEDAGFARYWHGGSPFRSLFWTQLSTAFEPGEKFFIDSARALKSEIHDPALLDELAEFCRQEGHHTAQHLKFDRINERLGVDVRGCRDRYAKVLERTRASLDPMGMLAVTVALEHFTAGFAEQYFDKPRLSEDADPGVQALWAWHAAEEAEHKATCFDIYQQLGGGYLRRVSMMFGAWSLILWLSLVNTHVLLWQDRKLFSLDTLRGYWYLFGRGGLVSGMGRSFLAYFSPRFHPWKADNSAQIRTWEAANDQYIVRRNTEPPPASQPAPNAA